MATMHLFRRCVPVRLWPWLFLVCLFLNAIVILYVAHQSSLVGYSRSTGHEPRRILAYSQEVTGRTDNHTFISRTSQLKANSEIQATTSRVYNIKKLDNSTLLSSDVRGIPERTVNGTVVPTVVQTKRTKSEETNERREIQCNNKDLKPYYRQRGQYWILYNYIRANRSFSCNESVTYTTHGDFTFLDNLIPLSSRWEGPVSIAVYAPGTDFNETVKSVIYLRECGNSRVKEFVTFHVYFEQKHMPKFIPKPDDVLSLFNISCSSRGPWLNSTSTYRRKHNMTYPVNVARNVAREAATTHYLLASDVELYPNPHLIPAFLEMIRRNDKFLQRRNPKVFVLSIFEVQNNVMLPNTKQELVKMLKNKTVIGFHEKVCAYCHKIPQSRNWTDAPVTDELRVFHVARRHRPFHHWEPIFIGTNDDPIYDERLSWEGKSDKMTQAYTLCVLDYEFHILNNGFLVHKPGIKKYHRNKRREVLVRKQNSFIKGTILKELQKLYPSKKQCEM